MLDSLDRISKITYNKNGLEPIAYEYEYDSNGNIARLVDGKNGTTTIYKYNASNKLIKMVEYDTEELENNFSVSYNYDSESRLKSSYYHFDYLYNSTLKANHSNYYFYSYNSDDTLKYMSITVGSSEEYRIAYSYDDFTRYTNKAVAFGGAEYKVTYEYLSYENKTSTLVSKYTVAVGGINASYLFTYDSALQNIEEVRSGGGNVLYKYTYDSLDRLVREDNSQKGKTYVYTYDNNGNILSEKVYAYTTGSVSGLTPVITNTYTYGNASWGDQLTGYNGIEIEYNSIGNPVTYYNGMSFTWENVSSLAGITQGTKTYTYTYNDSGIRTSKTINGVTHTYHLEGTRILSEAYGDKLILYIYDEAGSIIGMAYRDSTYARDTFDTYLFIKNLQGDITGIYNESGTYVAGYTYNAWGECTVSNHTSDNIGDLNPFRYRGYYYDTETGFYYLNARYYDPQIKRFISADHINYLGAGGDFSGFNLYAYANNNPIGIAYSGADFVGNSSGGMISSTGGTLSNVGGSGSVIGETKISGFSSSTGLSLGGINWPKVNSVAMTHYTTSLVENAFIGSFFGNISYTVTTQLNDSEMFYSYSNIGNGGYSAGVGMNLGNWYGISAYVSSNLGFGTSMQLTPWITYGAEISLQDGISFSFGTISGNTTQEITANVGWGTIAGAYLVCAGIAAIPMPGARALAGAAACVILLIDIFN